MFPHPLTAEERSRGGKAVASKEPPSSCPRCGKDMSGRVWHSYLGHLSLHSLADRYFAGDLDAAQERLRRNGLARQDPFPGNGAMPIFQPIGDELDER